MANSLYIIIVGCGRLGSTLASHLSSQGHSVVIIDTKKTAFQKLSTEFSGFQIVGDASELSLLKTAKLEKTNCLLAVTNQDNINLMVAQVAKTVFNVPTVLARVFDPNREGIYKEFGIETISPTKLSVEAFLEFLNN